LFILFLVFLFIGFDTLFFLLNGWSLIRLISSAFNELISVLM